MNRQNDPHIVKFSGGRSSGMMLMKMLQNHRLNPKRGDVIIFNNTSAEHSATYEFTRKMKKLAEEKYNIPFFWIEYQTYEDSQRSYVWTRRPTYRIVNDRPHSEENPDGYHYRGEVFEEMIAFMGYLPNVQSRTCTQSMKIFVTNSFLSDWFAQKSHIERQGHFWDSLRVSNDDIISMHKKSGGAVPDDILLSKKGFLSTRPFVRPKQFWKNFTDADIVIDNDVLRSSVFGRKAQLYGNLAVDYISLLGIRADEKRRMVKIKNRIDESQENNGKSLFDQPPGEDVLAPLVEENIVNDQVIDFWNKQDFNLNLPDNSLFSNCLYCPLKGQMKLLKIATEQLENNQNGLTPESIDWWINIEKKYSRDLIAEKRKITSKDESKYIGFFGATKRLVFEEIKKQAKNGVIFDKEILDLESDIPCNCTD